MNDCTYADEVDYKYLRTRLKEAETLLRTVLRDGEMNVHTVTGQLIHAWIEYSRDPTTDPNKT